MENEERTKIVLTGWAKREFKKELKAETTRCYICKRHQEGKDTESVAIVGENSVSFVPLKMFSIIRRMYDTDYHFLLCFECALLLNLFDEKPDAGQFAQYFRNLN